MTQHQFEEIVQRMPDLTLAEIRELKKQVQEQDGIQKPNK
jgi:hypothetical protein